MLKFIIYGTAMLLLRLHLGQRMVMTYRNVTTRGLYQILLLTVRLGRKNEVQQKDTSGGFFHPEVHLTLQKISFPYKMGEGEEGIFNNFKGKKRGKCILHLHSYK